MITSDSLFTLRLFIGKAFYVSINATTTYCQFLNNEYSVQMSLNYASYAEK